MKTQLRAFQLFPILCIVLVCCSLVEAQAAEKKYTVKKNDTLASIARSQRVPVAALLRSNEGLEPNKIFIGQVIRIPVIRPDKFKSSLNTELQASLAEIRVRPYKWKHIVIHHSGTEMGTAKGMDRYHREQRHMENGLAYHFVVGNGQGMKDGDIYVGPRWLEQIKGGHLASDLLNENSIGICLVGNFDDEKPTSRQLANLKALVGYLLNRCELGPETVKTHQQINTIFTRCPGLKFPAKSFLKDIKKSFP